MGKKFEKPPKELPVEMPTICMNSVFLGGFCEDHGPRWTVLKKMLTEFKKGDKLAIKFFHEYVKEHYPKEKEEYQKEHGISE
jgi:hypothetical protein